MFDRCLEVEAALRGFLGWLALDRRRAQFGAHDGE
jgi:hypothetical protein